MMEKDAFHGIPPFPLAPGTVPIEQIPVDPQGMYTGVPENEDEMPVQDADDL